MAEDSEYLDVRYLHEKFGQMVGDTPRHLTKRKLAEFADAIDEEVSEFVNACGLINSEDGPDHFSNSRFYSSGVLDQDLTRQADALVNLVCLVKSCAVSLGLPWSALWDDMNGATMSLKSGKLPSGPFSDIEDLKVLIPDGWIGPQTLTVLHEAGYDRANFQDENGRIHEADCYDDEEAPGDHRTFGDD